MVTNTIIISFTGKTFYNFNMENISMYYAQFNGFSSVFLDITMFICLLAGMLTIISKNPVFSVLYLILLFSGVSVYLILVGAKFLGISYLLVYVGAVSILFLFILMLINIRVSELTNDTSNYIPLAVIVILAFFVPLNKVLPYVKPEEQNISLDNFFSNTELKYVTSDNWEDCIVPFSDVSNIGNLMYSEYAIWLIITSIILLLAMVGSIAITVKQRY